MLRSSTLAILLAVPFLAFAAPVPREDDAVKLQRAYGQWSDPDKNCKYALKKGELRISLPANQHVFDVGAEHEINNAPRVLREVEGDFTAIVRVTYPILKQIPKQVPKDAIPYWSGGLVVWESKKAYLVVRRSAGRTFGKPETIWMQWPRENDYYNMLQSLNKPVKAAFLRLKRQGNAITAGWSLDGKDWDDFVPMKLGWGAKLKVGVVAENTMETPVEITFDQYSLTTSKK